MSIVVVAVCSTMTTPTVTSVSFTGLARPVENDLDCGTMMFDAHGRADRW